MTPSSTAAVAAAAPYSGPSTPGATGRNPGRIPSTPCSNCALLRLRIAENDAAHVRALSDMQRQNMAAVEASTEVAKAAATLLSAQTSSAALWAEHAQSAAAACAAAQASQAVATEQAAAAQASSSAAQAALVATTQGLATQVTYLRDAAPRQTAKATALAAKATAKAKGKATAKPQGVRQPALKQTGK